jgi:mannose-6-phosphate isomerase-like protein (cupin superfamily)
MAQGGTGDVPPDAGMSTTRPFHVGAPVERSGPWRILADAGSTAGALSVSDGHLPPHSPGPPRHVHTYEDEAIYVVAGVLTVEVGEQRYEAGPESFVWLPRQIPHAFANLSDEPTWTLGIVTPAGFEGMFGEHADYLRGLTGPPDEQVLTGIAARYGVFPVDGKPLGRGVTPD